MKIVLLALSLAACSIGSAAPKGQGPSDVVIELSSVTLADDCAPPAPPPVPAKSPKPAAGSSSSPPASMVPGTPCAGPGCGRGRCDQTSMQLSIKAPAMKTATTIKITKVELLDDKGKLLEVLASRAPKLWTAGTAAKYAPWDETLGGGQAVQAMYDLAMPHWETIVQGGRWQAHTKVFQLRVSITIGAGTKTSVSKQSITPVRLPPPVPT